LPVGEATVVRPGKSHKEIYVTPSGLQNGLEEVLIIVQGMHAPIPDSRPSSQDVHLMAPPPGEGSSDPAPAVSGTFTTDADRLTDHYRKIGEAEKHVYGGHSPGAPNYNIDLDAVSPKAAVSSKAAVNPKAPVSPKDATSPAVTPKVPVNPAVSPKAPVSPAVSPAVSPKDAVNPKPPDPKSPSPPPTGNELPGAKPLAAPPAANP
jgi:hypothetical protein